MRYFGVVAVTLLCLNAGCSEEQPPSFLKSRQVEVPTYNMNVVVTVGNHTYIPLNLFREQPSNNTTEILKVLEEFENTHPEFQVTDWKIEEQQEG